MKIFFIGLLCLACETLFAQSIELEVVFPKDTFLVAELVNIGLGVRNTNPRLAHKTGKMELNIINSIGERLPYVGPDVDFFSPFNEFIQPNEEDYKIIELNRFFGRSINRATIERYFAIGTYTLEVIYHYQDQQVTVNKPFSVIYPEGEEAIVYEKYYQILMELAKGLYTDMRQATDPLELLIEKYPQSVYMPSIIIWVSSKYIYWFNDEAHAKEMRKQLINNYPSSSFVIPLLKEYLKDIPSQTERTNILNKIILENKNPAMEKILKKEISKFQQ